MLSPFTNLSVIAKMTGAPATTQPSFFVEYVETQ